MELKESSSLAELRRQMLEFWIAGVAEIFIVESLRRGSYIGEGQKSAQRFPAGTSVEGWTVQVQRRSHKAQKTYPSAGLRAE